MANDKITPDTEVSTTELACVLGITGRRIRQLAEDGDIERIKPGKFNLSESVQRYIKLVDKQSSSNDEDAKFEKARKAADLSIKKSKADIARLEANELKGKMHRSEDVASLTEDLIYTIRGALLALPGQLSMDVAEAKTPAEAAEIIRKEVYRVMSELAKYKYDPRKYEERVRERQDWGLMGEDDYE